MSEQLELPLSPFESDEPIEEELAEDEQEEILDIEEEGQSEEEPIDEFDDEPEDDQEEINDDELEQLLDDDDDDDTTDEIDTVPHAALHKERERRKGMQSELVIQQGLLSEANTSIEEYQTTISDIEAQLKELGLEDTIDVKAPKEVSEEVREIRADKAARAQQEQVTTLVGDLRQEAALHLEEFPQIDGNDSEQAELILGFAMASTMLGAEIEDSVVKAMTILNKHLTVAKKSARRTSTTKPKQRSGGRRKAQGTTASAIRRAKPGNVKDVFRSMAEDFDN